MSGSTTKGFQIGAFLVSYMETWSKMVGFDQQHSIVVEKTLFGPEVDKEGREAAKVEAVALASSI